MAAYYQPVSDFKDGFIAYAKANLLFFVSSWLNQFIPNQTLVNSWPADKLIFIITELSRLQKQGLLQCKSLIDDYKAIYKALTLKDYKSKSDPPP